MGRMKGGGMAVCSREARGDHRSPHAHWARAPSHQTKAPRGKPIKHDDSAGPPPLLSAAGAERRAFTQCHNRAERMPRPCSSRVRHARKGTGGYPLSPVIRIRAKAKQNRGSHAAQAIQRQRQHTQESTQKVAKRSSERAHAYQVEPGELPMGASRAYPGARNSRVWWRDSGVH